jgi:hypothetical protein
MLKPFLLLSVPFALFANDGEDRLDTKFEVFHDRNDVTAVSPIFQLTKSIGRHFGIEWEGQLDAVTGASREWGLKGSGQILDANTGASAKLDGVSGASAREGGDIAPEIRAGSKIGLTWTDKKGGVLNGSLYASKENDYTSFSPALGGSWDFAERNTTVSWGGSWFFDRMTPYGEWGRLGGGAKRVQSYNLGLSQILTPLSLAGLNATFTRTTGYIGHPYNTVGTLDSGTVAENLPRAKDAVALAGQFIQGFHLGEQLGSVNAEYRWYTDSWNLRSHTLTVRWNQHVSDASVVRLQGRVYTQTAAAFARKTNLGNEIYRTADIRFFAFNSYLLGAKYSSEFPEEWAGWLPRRWDLSYDHLVRDTKGNTALYQFYAADAWYMQGTARAGLSWDL